LVTWLPVGDADMKPYFEPNKNRKGDVEYPFYIADIITEEEGYEVTPHWHYHMELLYLAYGTAQLQSGAETIIWSAGSLILIHPCEVHAIRVAPGQHTKHYVIGFNPDLLAPMPNLALQLRYVTAQSNGIMTGGKLVKMEAKDQIWLNSFIERLKQEYEQHEPGFELTVSAQLFELIAWLIRHPQPNSLSAASLNNHHADNWQMLRPALDQIERNANQQISAASAAQLCSLSYSHFAKRFKQVTQISFTQYLTHARIRKAEHLLLNTELSMTQIALEIGFQDTSYFIKQFRLLKGLSPKQYRIKQWAVKE
jgi:AraC-like DNA-binding protein